MIYCDTNVRGNNVADMKPGKMRTIGTSVFLHYLNIELLLQEIDGEEVEGGGGEGGE